MRSFGRTRVVAALLALGVGAACDDGLGPATDLTVFVSVSRDVVLLGDTVQLVGVAHNGAGATIDAGGSCAPGIKFLVRDTAGDEIDLYAGRAFICPRLDSHDIEPGETDVVQWTWAPEVAGEYSVQGAVSVRDGPTIRSSSADVRVIEEP